MTETWFTKEYTETLQNYNDYHTVRESGRSGGVSIYVKNEFKSEKIDNFSFANLNIEVCTVKVTMATTNVILIGVYRPHSGTLENFNDYIVGILDSINSLSSNTCILTGDFNFDLLRCDLGSNILVNSLHSYHFISIINKPTRFPTISSHSPSLLDQIWTNNLNYSDSGILLTDVSDHLPSFINFIFNSRKKLSGSKTKISFRIFNEANKDSFFQAMQTYDWNGLISDDINIYVENFVKTLNDLYNEFFPLKTKFISTNHTGKPWITPQIKKLSKMKSQYYNMCLLGILSVNENNQFKNKVVRILKKSKTRYYENAFARNRTNIKGTWRLINELASRGISQNKIRSIIWSNVEFFEDDDIAKSFSEYFSSVAPALNSDIPDSNANPLSYIANSVPRSLFLSPILPHECEKIVKTLKNTKEKNFIPITLFKLNIAAVLPTLCKMINQMFSSGTFPNSFKTATITPIPKKGDRSNPTNYRPISILLFLSKLFEKFFLLRLFNFISKKRNSNPLSIWFHQK